MIMTWRFLSYDLSCNELGSQPFSGGNTLGGAVCCEYDWEYPLSELYGPEPDCVGGGGSGGPRSGVSRPLEVLDGFGGGGGGVEVP